MAGPFAPSGRRAAARRRTPGGLGPRARPRPRCGLGLGAALWAGRKRPGPRPSPPHTPPARLGAADGKARGCQPCGLVGAPVRALWARPSRPQRPAGRYPCPPWAAWAPPAPPACGGRGVVAAGRRLRRLRSAPLRGLPAASRCAGPPSRAARPSPLRGPLRGPCPPPAPRRLRRRCSGPPRPHSWGLLGRCGPPARACLAPASRPALARLRLCPRWRGSACARPARRSGPAPLRRPAAEPRGGVRALWARPVRGRNLDAARKGLARFAGRGPIPRRARLWRGVTPPAGGSATSPTIRQGQDKPPAAGLV